MDDDFLNSFNEEAQSILDMSSDSSTGLDVLRDMYSEIPEAEQAAVKQSYIDYSDTVRKKFDETDAFDYNTTLEIAPVNMDDLSSDLTSPEDIKLDLIHQWKNKNLEALKNTNDPFYLQSKSQLERGITQAATIQEREYYGKDNYLLTDMALRFGQGLLGKIPDLLASDTVAMMNPNLAYSAKSLGLDKLNDWFTVQTDPDGADLFGYKVGGDEGYSSAIASGLGSVTGAVGSGMLVPGVGTGLYLGAQGAGSAVDQYETSRENEGSMLEALGAAGIEAGNQALQTVIGSKVLGAISEKLLGTATKEAVKNGGARIFTKSIKPALIEGTTESVGGIVSNVASYVGGEDDVDFFKGWKQNFVAGFIPTAGLDAYSNIKNASMPEDVTVEPVMSEEVDASLFTEETLDPVTSVDGYPAPKPEIVPDDIQTVNPENTFTLSALSDGTELISDGNNIYLKKGDNVLQPYDAIKFVEPEDAAKLIALTQSANPDGTAITLAVNKQGDLIVKSPYVNDDLTISNKRTGKGGVRVNTASEPGNKGVIFANKQKLKKMTVDPYEGEQSVKTNGFYIADGTVDQSVGAGHISDFLKQNKEGQVMKRYREKYGDTNLIERGLLQEGFEYKDDKGQWQKSDNWSLTRSPNTTIKESTNKAVQLIQEKGGLFETLDYLKGLKKYDEVDNAAIIYILEKAKQARLNADLNEDYSPETQAFYDLENDLLDLNIEVGAAAGRTLQIRGDASKNIIANITEGDSEVMGITRKLITDKLKEANAEINGDGTSQADARPIAQELNTDKELLATLEKQATDPVDNEIDLIDQTISEIDTNTENETYTKPITQYEKDIKDLKILEENAKLKLKNNLSEADLELKNAIETTAEELNIFRTAVSEELNQEVKPTKAQITQLDSIETQLAELESKPVISDEQSAKLSELDKKLNNETDEAKKAKIAKRRDDLLESIRTKAANNKNKYTELVAKRDSVVNEITTRVSKDRKPTSEQAKKLSALQGRLKTLLKQAEGITQVNPKKSPEVKKFRNLATQRVKAIRSLKKQKKTEVKEPTPRQKQLMKKKSDLISAKKEGNLRVDKELQTKIKETKKRISNNEKKLNVISEKIREAKNAFPETDRQRLKALIDSKHLLKSPTEYINVEKEIIKIMSKHLPPTPNSVDFINNYWRRNVLSGPKTIMRDASFNLGIGLMDTVGYTVSAGPKAGYQYIKGRWKSLKRAALESGEIFKGNRSGRMALGDDSMFAPSPILPTDSKGNTNVTALNAITIPFRAINEVVQRIRAVNDSFFYRNAQEGRAYLAAHQMAVEQNIAPEDLETFMANTLYNSDSHLEKVTTEVDTLVGTLKSAGVEFTPKQRELAIFERMEANRSEIIRKLSDAHAEKSVLLQEPEGAIGLIANAIVKLGNDSVKAGYGIPIPVSKDANGKYAKWYPFKHMSNFLRTTANATQAMMRPTPLGFIEASRMYNKPVKVGDVDVINNTDAKAVAAQALIGSALLGIGYSLVVSQKDEERPWVQFYGVTPRGKYQEWKEKGIKEFSVRIGDNTIVLKNTPLVLLTALLGAADEAVRKDQDIEQVGTNVALAGLGAVANMSFLKDASEFFNMLSGGDNLGSIKTDKSWIKSVDRAKSIGANFLSGFLPSIGFMRNAGDWINNSPVDTFNEFEAKLLGRIPYAQELGIGKPALNWFGEPIKKSFEEKSGLDLWFMNAPTDPVNLWMKQSGYTITPPDPLIEMTKSQVTQFGAKQEKTTGYKELLDEDQSRRVLEKSGPIIKNYLNTLKDNPMYQTYNEKNQTNINSRVSSIRARARYDVLYGR